MRPLPFLQRWFPLAIPLAVILSCRVPQTELQVSGAVGVPGDGQGSRAIWFYLVDNFVVPKWGDAANVAFKQRLMFEPGDNRQVVRLYWTRLSGNPTKEFLAGEYVYTRKE